MKLLPNSEKYTDKRKQLNLFDIESVLETRSFNSMDYGELPGLMNAEVNFYYLGGLERSDMKRELATK